MTDYLTGRRRFPYYDLDRDGADEAETYGPELLWDHVGGRCACTDMSRMPGVIRHFWKNGELHPAVSREMRGRPRRCVPRKTWWT